MISEQQKKIFFDELRKTSIIQIACKRAGFGRSTYYELIHKDPNFAQAAEEAKQEGVALINDMAKSKLIGKINEGALPAVMYWLNHRDPDFSRAGNTPKKEVRENLTDEQFKLLVWARGLTPNDLTPATTHERKIKKKKTLTQSNREEYDIIQERLDGLYE